MDKIIDNYIVKLRKIAKMRTKLNLYIEPTILFTEFGVHSNWDTEEMRFGIQFTQEELDSDEEEIEKLYNDFTDAKKRKDDG